MSGLTAIPLSYAPLLLKLNLQGLQQPPTCAFDDDNYEFFDYYENLTAVLNPLSAIKYFVIHLTPEMNYLPPQKFSINAAELII